MALSDNGLCEARLRCDKLYKVDVELILFINFFTVIYGMPEGTIRITMYLRITTYELYLACFSFVQSMCAYYGSPHVPSSFMEDLRDMPIADFQCRSIVEACQ